MPVTPDLILKTVMRDRPKLHGYAWVVVGDPDLADDVLQEVSLLALEKAEQINDEPHLQGWLRESIRRRGLAVRRERYSDAAQLSQEVLAVLAEVQTEVFNEDQAVRMKALRHCIDLLGEKSRATLAMRYGKGMKPAEIAERTGRPVRSVYQMITRSHTNLRDCILERIAQKGALDG